MVDSLIKRDEGRDAAIVEAVNELSEPEVRQLYARLNKPEFFEYPVDIRTFVEHPDYLNLGPKNGRPSQFWPEVLNEMEELFRRRDNGDFQYNEFALLKGIGSGKSFEAAAIIIYLAYLVLCFKNPHENFNLADNTQQAAIIVAPTGGKARDTSFGYAKIYVDSSPWFRTYYPRDKDIDTRLRFDHAPEDSKGNLQVVQDVYFKNVLILTGNSSKTAPLGMNLFGAVIEEANFWETYESISKGKNERVDEMFLALQRRIVSRYDRWGLLGIISSSLFEDDYIESKFDEAEEDDLIYAVRKSLWEMKPIGSYSANTFPVEATLRGKQIVIDVPVNLKREFTKRPMESLRDFWRISIHGRGHY